MSSTVLPGSASQRVKVLIGIVCCGTARSLPKATPPSSHHQRLPNLRSDPHNCAMTTYTTTSVASAIDAAPLTLYAWQPPQQPRGVVQISHGAAEHAVRYDRLARALTAADYAVYAHDHRGHGTSTSEQVALGGFGTAGWSGLVSDLAALSDQIRTQRPDLPLFLVGHSMGSFALQEAILDHSALYAGVVLSGSTSVDLLAARLTEAGGASGDLSAFNAGFNHRTGYEWLSRDEAEVDKYVADPLCGFAMDAETIPAMFGSGVRLGDRDALSHIRSDLPILLVSGDADPLAGGGQLVEVLGQRYRDSGVTDVTVQLFPGARHEIFNELNRDEITTYVVDWLARHTPSQ
jgi:alpha-beta hydrolase superfamily lysophospholipase